MFLDIFDGSGEFDAACLASATGVDLSFDHDGCTESFRGVHCFLDGECNFTVRDRHSELFEELFALIFEEIHGGSCLGGPLGDEVALQIRHTRWV